MKKIRLRISNKTFDAVNIALLIAITVVVLYPLYFTVIASFSDPYAVSRGQVIFWVREFTTEAYKNVFANNEIWVGYANSIINTVVKVLLSLCMTMPAAFVMSRRGLKGQNLIMGFFVFTMYFNGGMITHYLLIRNMGLLDTRSALILPGIFSVYNMIIARTSMQTNLPEELCDAARIDGCSVFGIFFNIALPLSKAIIAVVALYVAVGEWSSWFDALLYITNKALYPLQYVLRSILIQNQELTIIDTGSMDGLMMDAFLRRKLMAEGMKYSLIFISSLPMLAAYPFVQKYFVKGVMIGSVKS